MNHLFGRLICRADQLLELLLRHVETLVLLGIYNGQLFPRFIVLWKIFQPLDVLRGQFGGIVVRGLDRRRFGAQTESIIKTFQPNAMWIVLFDEQLGRGQVRNALHRHLRLLGIRQ